MRRRIYYVLPDMRSARRAMEDLLLARVEERRIHFVAKPGISMDGLHEASVLQKSDIVHGAQLGLKVGALTGGICGGVLVYFVLTEPEYLLPAVLGLCALGALFGAWVASMVGSAFPNSRLRQFESMLARGRILLMIDVPEHKVEEIKVTLGQRHPEAIDGGTEPAIPAFP